jgi:hypothetical protein
MRPSNLVVVRAFATHGEANVAKSLLESSGIEAMIQADTAGGMREHLAWSGLGFRVFVREEDAAAAREALTPPADRELVVIQTFATESDAETAQGQLLAADISAIVENDSSGGSRHGGNSSATGYRVLVPAEDAAAAREVLKLPSKMTPVGTPNRASCTLWCYLLQETDADEA